MNNDWINTFWTLDTFVKVIRFVISSSGRCVLFGSRFTDINLKGDMFGGVTTAIISTPLALAFGVASGAELKLACGAPLWLAYLVVLFGVWVVWISGTYRPDDGDQRICRNDVSMVAGSILETGMAMTFTVVMMAGAFQILLGTLKQENTSLWCHIAWSRIYVGHWRYSDYLAAVSHC